MIFPSFFCFPYPAKGTETLAGSIHELFLLSVISSIGEIPWMYVEKRTFAKRISFLGKRHIFPAVWIHFLIFQLLFPSTWNFDFFLNNYYLKLEFIVLFWQNNVNITHLSEIHEVLWHLMLTSLVKLVPHASQCSIRACARLCTPMCPL